MDLQVRSKGPGREGVVVLAVSGDLDYDTEQILGAAGSRAVQGGCRRLVVECSGVTFCDSRGLGCLLQLRREAQDAGAELVLAAISYPVRLVLELTDALEACVLAGTVEQALRFLDDADTPSQGIPAI